MENRIDAFLTLMHELGASDLCISTGHRVTARISGAIEALRYPPISEDGFRRMIIPILRQGQWDRFDETGDLDLAYEVPNVARFRVNLFKHQDGYGSVFRSIPTKILSMRDLSFPDAIARIPHFRSGLALITGPTGSGKSTTLAAIIHEINLTKPQHIITIEDPLEFVHQNRRCRFSQREIGTHAQSFSDALRSAIREDPDVVLVGELRDLETIRMALKAAETGLLVFSTLHTNTAIKTVDRVVTVFSSEEQESVRRVLADSLRAVVSQQLIPKIGGGRVAAHEILFGSPALGALIREGKTSQIINLIQTGRNAGMIDMDTAILNLVQSGVIEPSHAFEKSINKDKFKKKLDALIPRSRRAAADSPRQKRATSASARRRARAGPSRADPGGGRRSMTRAAAGARARAAARAPRGAGASTALRVDGASSATARRPAGTASSGKARRPADTASSGKAPAGTASSGKAPAGEDTSGKARATRTARTSGALRIGARGIGVLPSGAPPSGARRSGARGIGGRVSAVPTVARPTGARPSAAAPSGARARGGGRRTSGGMLRARSRARMAVAPGVRMSGPAAAAEAGHRSAIRATRARSPGAGGPPSAS